MLHCVLPAGSEDNVTALVWPVTETACHVNGPTEAVMSVLPLKAKAWYSVLSGLPEGARFERQSVERVGGWFGALLMTMFVMCW